VKIHEINGLIGLVLEAKSKRDYPKIYSKELIEVLLSSHIAEEIQSWNNLVFPVPQLHAISTHFQAAAFFLPDKYGKKHCLSTSNCLSC
jgi:hypothetical protein